LISYGYKDLIFIEDYIQENLFLFPYLGKGITQVENPNEKPIKNIIVFGLPKDWCKNLNHNN